MDQVGYNKHQTYKKLTNEECFMATFIIEWGAIFSIGVCVSRQQQNHQLMPPRPPYIYFLINMSGECLLIFISSTVVLGTILSTHLSQSLSLQAHRCGDKPSNFLQPLGFDALWHYSHDDIYYHFKSNHRVSGRSKPILVQNDFKMGLKIN